MAKKGKDGVVLITTNKNHSQGNEGKMSDVKVIGPGGNGSTRIFDSKVQFRNTGENITHPLILLNGVAVDIDVNNIDPNSIETVEVFKDKSAKDKYGEKGKDGVIEITTKKVVVQEKEKKLSSTLIIESGSCDTIKVSAYGGVQFKHDYEKNAISLYVLDDVITSIDDLDKVNPETFKVIKVIKGKDAIDKYGEKGKNGVIEITTKK
jgi:hypothetical protein